MKKLIELIILGHIEEAYKVICKNDDYDLLSEQCCVIGELCEILSEAKDNMTQDCKKEIAKRLSDILKDRPAEHEWPEFMRDSCDAINDLLRLL